MHARVSWVSDAGAFARLGGTWDRLARSSGPFASSLWFDAWWRAFGRDAELAMCLMHEGGELVGAYPLRRGRSGLRALANSETPTFRPLARDDGVLSALTDVVFRSATQLEIPSLPAGEPAHTALRERVRANGGRDVSLLQYESPLVITTGSFDDYRAARKPAWRETERRSRKAMREHDTQLELIAAPEHASSLLEEGLALEAAGWKGRRGTAILDSPATACFYREIARRADERGELRLSSLRIDRRLVAFDLALLVDNRYYLLKTAFDESARSLSPGLVLRRAVVEQCFRSGLDAHKFLGIDMPWKRLFSTGVRPHVRYRAYPAGPLNGLRHAYRARMRPRARRLTRHGRELLAKVHHPS